MQHPFLQNSSKYGILNIAIYAENTLWRFRYEQNRICCCSCRGCRRKQEDAENIINATLAQIEKVLVAGDKVQFVGFGTFETRERGERTAKNPQTGAEITIPASNAPA